MAKELKRKYGNVISAFCPGGQISFNTDHSEFMPVAAYKKVLSSLISYPLGTYSKFKTTKKKDTGDLCVHFSSLPINFYTHLGRTLTGD